MFTLEKKVISDEGLIDKKNQYEAVGQIWFCKIIFGQRAKDIIFELQNYCISYQLLSNDCITENILSNAL